MKLKLTDKIRKFFGPNHSEREAEDGLDGDMPAYGGSLEASLANLAAIKPSAARQDAQQHHIYPQQLHPRSGYTSPAPDQSQGSGTAAAAAAAGEKQAQLHVQLHPQQQVPHHQQLPSCTNSQKDAKDFSSGLRTTGQDESYSLQNEVYFPQLLLTLQGGTPEQKAVAAEALFNYTAESDAARQRATQAGVVGHLVDLLRTGTEHGKMYAAYTLSSLTTIDESLEQMHSHGAISALIDILSTCPLLVCKKGAMRALGRLARSDEAAQEIVAAGGLGPIISLLSRPDSSLVRRCLIALYFIGADKDGLQQAIGAAGALPQLLLLARSDSPDVQAEATDVLKVLCRNASCGRMLADLNGIEVLVTTAHTGLTSRAKAAATRALQRLHDIPELKDALAASTARDMQLEPSMSPSQSSQLNSSSAAPAAASVLAAAAAAAPAPAASAGSGQLTAAVTAAVQAAVAFSVAPAQAAGGSSAAVGAPAGSTSAAVVSGAGLLAGGAEVEDIWQLAQVLASGNSRWLREKAAAAVEQLATDNPAACRELAGLGVLPALLDMLDASNSSSTRRAAARALGQLSDDAVMLVHMADKGIISNLLVATPQLTGSAQRAVIRVLHSLASVPNAVLTCFPRQQAIHSMMHTLEGTCCSSSTAAAAAAAGGAGQPLEASLRSSTMSGGSNGGGGCNADGGVSSRALEVLLAVCRADEEGLTDVKEYTGGFKLLVNQLQHGPRSTASLILQLLSILAQHNQHQEDLLKCGVVPTLLMLYRSDDSAVALQAARIMEALSEPASTILQRSLSAGNGRLGADSSSGSSCGNTPTAAATAAGSGVSGSAAALQSPYGLPPRGPLQRSSELADQGTKGGQQEALVSSSSDSSAEYVTCNSHNSSAGGCADTQHVAEAGSGTAAGPRRSTGPTPRQSAGAALDQGAAQPPASSSNSSIQAAGGTAGSSAPAAVAAAQQAEGSSAEPSSSGAHAGTISKQAAATVAVAAADKPSVELPAGSCSPSSSSTSSTGSPARRVAAVAAALEAAALASSSSSVDGCSASSAVPVSPGAVGRARQSSIPTLSRAGSKTPSGLGAPPLLVKRPTSGKTEQPGEPLQQQQQQLAVEQDHTEQPSPSTAQYRTAQSEQQQQQQQQAQQQPEQQPNQVEASQQDQRPQQQQVQQQQQRMQPLQQQAHQHLPSRLPRRLPHAPGSSGPHGSSSSSSMTDPGSRTGTPDPIKRRQHPAAHHPSGGAKLPHGGSGSATTAGGRTSASPVHLRVLAAQKKSQRNLASAADGGDSPAPGTPSAGPPQQPFEVAGTGRVMQMAAAIVANAEAAARSASPQRLVKQPSQLQAQLQQQAQQQPQQQPTPLGQGQAGKPSSSSAAAENATPAGQGSNSSTANNGGSSSSSNRPAGSKSPGKADGGVPASASAPASSSPARDAAAAAAPPAHFAVAQDRLGGSHAAAAAVAGPPPAAEADDLLSSTYDNLHGLLLKKSDIEVCRTAEGRKCRLGEGGFGVVYKAVMNGVDEVAVKLVKAETPSRKELELFLKEVQTLAKLHHRNIVQFYGACLEMGSMFFVTELMKGGDLYSALRHHSETMKWERLGRKVALDVALGLNYLHAQRPPMMHRDLKSPNVLLSEEGVAKIADVGMVRSQVKDLVTAQPVMTPLWAAPEVVRHERASIKADIWSYGILIWELITGEDITEYQPLSISRQVGPSPNAKAMTLPARCPAVARKLFVACTQMDPERRPGAQQLVEWLRADIASSRS